jgi:mannitol-1-phosphate 5-dehydrogenase
VKDTAVIFGAGKTGRGFAAHLAYLGGCRIVLVDKNKALIDALKDAGAYNISVLGNPHLDCTVEIAGAYHIDDLLWHQELVTCHIIFTAVFGNNLQVLAIHLVAGLQKRYQQNREQLLSFITCENLTNAAELLQKAVSSCLDTNTAAWLKQSVGFSEAIVFRTTLEAADKKDILSIRAQNYFVLPCNGDELKQKLPVFGLKPLNNFHNQLKRKIYTYNCINAVVTYLAAQKGYIQLYEGANDPEILTITQLAARETCRAQVLEFGFDESEQTEWMNDALKKFGDSNIPDPITRNAADPTRKLRRDDRLIGPALVALKHGITPEGIMAGILACFAYRDVESQKSVADLIAEEGIEYVLTSICGLHSDETLFGLLKSRMKVSYPEQ